MREGLLNRQGLSGIILHFTGVACFAGRKKMADGDAAGHFVKNWNDATMRRRRFALLFS